MSRSQYAVDPRLTLAGEDGKPLAMAKLPSMAEQISVDQIGENEFVSTVLPQRLGNQAPIAYGGCTASLAVHSACHTVKPNYHLYSVLGSFHGPTKIDRKVNCHVTRTRDTKTFATRRVVTSQTQDDGTERTCCDVFVDFHVLEPELFRYSVKPAPEYSHGPDDPKATSTNPEIAARLISNGHIPQAAAEANQRMFAMADAFFETRSCLAGVSGQNLMGIAKNVRTTQDHLPLADRTSAEWLRIRQPLETESQHMAALAFLMDGALSFLPLNLDKKNFVDAGACSTLEFALRIMVPGIRADEWHLRERRTMAAAVGRSYAEGRLFDEQGNVVAVETQSCIIRPPPGNSRAKI